MSIVDQLVICLPHMGRVTAGLGTGSNAKPKVTCLSLVIMGPNSKQIRESPTTSCSGWLQRRITNIDNYQNDQIPQHSTAWTIHTSRQIIRAKRSLPILLEKQQSLSQTLKFPDVLNPTKSIVIKLIKNPK